MGREPALPRLGLGLGPGGGNTHWLQVAKYPGLLSVLSLIVTKSLCLFLTLSHIGVGSCQHANMTIENEMAVICLMTFIVSYFLNATII